MLLLSRLTKYPPCLCLWQPHLQPPPQLSNLDLRTAPTRRRYAINEPLLKQLPIHLGPHQGCLPVRDGEQGVRVLGQEAVGVLVGLAEGGAGRSEVGELLV